MHALEQLRSGALAGQPRVGIKAGLTEFPTEIFQLADSLEILDLSGNALCALPDDLPRLHKLRILFCSHNQFTELPPMLGQCQSLQMVGFKANHIHTVPAQSLPPLLRWLTLTDNQIEELPKEIGQCVHLQKLMLAGNRLRALPASMAACHRLELLRIAANDLAVLPDWLFDLPRLSWLAFAGNPFGAELQAAALAHRSAALPLVPWPSVQLHELLGEGASGLIHRASIAQNGATQTAAVKLFKGAMTSDGLPHSELAACLRAGHHPHLIALRGRVGAHPQGHQGLVMDLIDPAFQTLAAPPSLESCTRDIYAPDRRFDLTDALRIACAIASAACHLHRQGVLHGDLYAHNTLHNAQGQATLGDFGAASLYQPEDLALGERLQRVEARAFGYLLEELLDRADAASGSEAVVDRLQGLVTRCLSESPPERPLFAEIDASLVHSLAALKI
ncbi:MAG: leucine-rich repeat-containing protein kinase family protein [Rhodoferax sp.]|nr:leucine-rich repeat-containing protein kinase family protein [Rhodoferax sp.]